MSPLEVEAQSPLDAAQVLARVGLKPGGRSLWGETLPCKKPGLYLVQLPLDAVVLGNEPQLSLDALADWLARASQLRVDGMRPTPEQLAARLARFWWPESRLLYTGCTTRPLASRVSDYRRHVLGRDAPHRGGQWLKALRPKVLASLEVVWLESQAAVAGDLEDDLLDEFADLLVERDPSRARLALGELLPFANIRPSKGADKPHGITGVSEG
ncbi:MAG: hypothetical protein IT348_16265 [Candidatus Eisenbacteria bacterium]|nr:hypothetical protein [Candidatus Eisenbacteria bacterium]